MRICTGASGGLLPAADASSNPREIRISPPSLPPRSISTPTEQPDITYPNMPSIASRQTAFSTERRYPLTSKSRVLFVLKQNQVYGYPGYSGSSGLRTSAEMCSDMLNSAGIPSKLVVVVDNNSIDREVDCYDPTHVIIEALWVVPEKFDILSRLHPTVNWIIRLHSELPFLATEGVAIEWVRRYISFPTVWVAANSSETMNALATIVGTTSHPSIVYLPNYYAITSPARPPSNRAFLDVGCFGAIRPLKNQLIQAIAAIQYANSKRLKLRFHMNATRQEQQGESVFMNIVSLFSSGPHQLILHPWISHPEFVKLLASMDLGMSVSLTESFCIVAADTIAAKTPLVCSPSIRWAAKASHVEPTTLEDITKGIGRVLGVQRPTIQYANSINLQQNAAAAQKAWVDYFG